MAKRKPLPEIEPCPFCGGKGSDKLQVAVTSFGDHVQCLNPRCQAIGPIRKTTRGAINAYNHRHYAAKLKITDGPHGLIELSIVTETGAACIG